MGLICLEPAALKQAARDLDLAQARLDSVDLDVHGRGAVPADPRGRARHRV